MRLSVLDQSPIADGATAAAALANSIDLARAAERLGYHRYWVAEHRASPHPLQIEKRGHEGNAYAQAD